MILLYHGIASHATGRYKLGSKTKSTSNQTQSGSTTASYGWQDHPETADVATLRGMVAPVTPDPGIAYSFGQQRNALNNTYRNPLGAYTSPAVRDAANRSAGQGFAQAERVASESSRRQAQDQAFGQQSYIAQLTDPRLVQTGGTSQGTSSGTQTQTYNPGIGSYISQAAGIGVGLL